MNNKIFIHIGFGRTSTTTLQTNIFYQLVKFKNINYIYGKSFLINNNFYNDNFDKEKKYKLYLSEIEKIKKLNDNDIFLSDEGLISEGFWSPSTYENKLKMNLDYFGSEANIIISIRKPSDWLSSIYRKFSNGKSTKEFFLDEKTYYNATYKEKFLIENFSYENILKKYSKNFKNVYIVKYEEIKNFDFLKNIFKLDSNEINLIKDIYSKVKLRQSLSFYGYKFELLIDKLDNYINLRKYINVNVERVDRYLQKILPSKKINVNFNNLPINIEKLDEIYKLIK